MHEGPPVSHPEFTSHGPADAILLHGYWMSEPSPGNVELSLRSRLAVRAAVLAYDNGLGASHIVADLGYIWGRGYPTEGSLIMRELTGKYGIPEHAVTVREQANSTNGEVQTALELARERGWNSITDIAFAKHHAIIPLLFRGATPAVSYRSVESVILERDPNPHVKNLVRRLSASGYERNFWIYQTGIRVAMMKPGFDYRWLEERNNKKRTGSGKDFIVSYDVFSMQK